MPPRSRDSDPIQDDLAGYIQQIVNQRMAEMNRVNGTLQGLEARILQLEEDKLELDDTYANAIEVKRLRQRIEELEIQLESLVASKKSIIDETQRYQRKSIPKCIIDACIARFGWKEDNVLQNWSISQANVLRSPWLWVATIVVGRWKALEWATTSNELSTSRLRVHVNAWKNIVRSVAPSVEERTLDKWCAAVCKELTMITSLVVETEWYDNYNTAEASVINGFFDRYEQHFTGAEELVASVLGRVADLQVGAGFSRTLKRHGEVMQHTLPHTASATTTALRHTLKNSPPESEEDEEPELEEVLQERTKNPKKNKKWHHKGKPRGGPPPKRKVKREVEGEATGAPPKKKRRH